MQAARNVVDRSRVLAIFSLLVRAGEPSKIGRHPAVTIGRKSPTSRSRTFATCRASWPTLATRKPTC